MSTEKKSRIRRFSISVFAVFSLFPTLFVPDIAHALLEGETVSDTSTYSYALGYWDGAYYAGVAVEVNGSSCAANYATIYSPGFSSQGYGPSSVSTTCSRTAGPPGTTYTFTRFYNALGSGWVSSPGATYTVSAPICTSFSYSDWSECGPSGRKTRTVLTRSPSGCTGGSPEIETTCTYVAPPATVNGSCGSSAGQYYYSAPTSGLCSAGSASASGSWSWQCTGSGGGTTASCSAYQKVDCVGSWGTCSGGSQTYSITTSASAGLSCPYTNGATRSCGTPASCGSANGGSFTSAPSSSLCSSGTPGGVSGSGPWSWSCNSSDGGTSASCSASVSSPSLAPTANISNGSPLPNISNPPGAYTLTGSVNNTGGPYSGSNSWYYGTNGGTGRTYLGSAGSGETVTSYTGGTGPYDNITYNFYLCPSVGSCSNAVNLKIVKATPSISWANPANITYGTALGSSQLNATANVAGTFSYSPPVGTVLNAAAGDQTLSVTFTPNDTTNYSSRTVAVDIVVNKKTLTVTADNKSKVAGDANPALTASYSGFVNGDTSVAGAPSLSTTAVTASGAGSYPITVTAGTLSSSNYSFSFVNGTLTVTQASQALTTVVASGSGSFDCSTNGGSSYSACASTYSAGTSVSVRALPSSGYAFSGWQDCGNPVENVCVGVVMNRPRSVSANFTAIPVNALSVQTTLDGSPYSLTVSQVGGNPSGLGGATPYSRSTTDSIDATLRAPSLGGNYFSGWSGCPSVSGADCRVLASGGVNKSVVAKYLSPSALPNLTVSLATKGATQVGGGYLASSAGVDTNLYGIVTVSNGGGGPAYESFSVEIKMQNDVDGTLYPGGGMVNGISNGATKKISSVHALYAGVWTITGCVDTSNQVQEGNESDNCVSQKVILTNETPPSPMPTCTALFNNVIGIDGAGAWTTNVNGSIQGCPSTRYRSLRVSGQADDYVPVSTTFSQVFDIVQGFYRNITGTEASAMCSSDFQAIESSSGQSACSGDLQFGDITGLAGGSLFNALYRNSLFSNNFLFEVQKLPWGNYPFYINNYFEGEYACKLGGTQTVYHPECDSKHIDYNPSACGSSVETQIAAVGQDWRSFARPINAVNTQLTLCAFEPANRDQQGEYAYFDTQCTPHNPDSASVSIDCGSYTASGVATISTPPVQIPGQSPRPVFTHTLTVNSTQDNASSPGVNISQYSVTSGVLPTGGARTSPTTESLPNTTFGGPTNYYKTADRNFTLVLEAPATRTTPSGTFSGWKLKTSSDLNGCDNTSRPSGDPVGAPDRLCEVSFAFNTLGGQSRTLTANYIGLGNPSAVAPVALACETSAANSVGKTNVSWASVAGAQSYKLYRGTTSGFAADSASQVDADPNTSGVQAFNSVPNPFVDSGLTPNTDYYYKVVAYSGTNGSGNSSAESLVSSVVKSNRYCNPGVPTSPVATAGACIINGDPAANGRITISWVSPSNSGVGDGFGPVTGYHIYENGTKITGTNGWPSSLFTRSNRIGATNYTYKIAAIGKGGVDSGQATALPDPVSIPFCKPNLIPTVLSDTNTSHPKIFSQVLNPNNSCKVNSDIVFALNPKNIGSTFTSPTFYNKIQRADHGQTNFVDVGTTPSIVGGLGYNVGITDDSVRATYTWKSSDKNPGGYDFRYCIDSTSVVDEGKLDGSSGEGDNCSDVVATCTSGIEPATVDLQVRKAGVGSYVPALPATNHTFNINYGEKVDLQWTSTNVAVNGCTAAWTPQKGVSGTHTTETLSNATQSYAITCTGLDGVNKTSNTITVTVSAPTLSCSGSLSANGFTALWSAIPTPLSLSGSLIYSYVWSGTDIPAGTTGTMSASNNANNYTINYTTEGSKSASVTMTPTGRPAITANCTTTPPVCGGANALCPKPDLTPLDPPNKPLINGGTADVTILSGTSYTLAAQPKNIGAGTTKSFQVKFQYKLSGQPDTSYTEMSSAATVSGGLAAGATVTTSAITFPTAATDAQTYNFRYCVDLPQTVASATVIGNVDESNENNNCSAPATLTLVKGTLSCTPAVASNSLPWTQTNGTNVSVFRGTTLVQTVTGASGTVTDVGLTPGTLYTYYLRNGNTSTSLQLATVTCTPIFNPPTVSLQVRKAATGSYVPVPPANYTFNINYGESVDLQWSSTNTASCTSASWMSPASAATSGTQLSIGPLSSASQTYTVTCKGLDNSSLTSNTITVAVAAPTLSCTGSLSGLTGTWTATPSPATIPAGVTYSYVWSGSDVPPGPTPPAPTGTPSPSQGNNTLTVNYTTSSSKTASVTMTPTGRSALASVACTPLGGLNPKPDLTPLGATGATPGPNAPVITARTNNPDGTSVAGTVVTFRVDPANIGAGFTSPNFTVKLQAKLTSGGAYADLGTATISGGLEKGSTVNGAFTPAGATKSATINHTSGVTENRSWDFRYCIDTVPDDGTGAVNEGTNEGNNCSGTVTVQYGLRPPATVTLQVRKAGVDPYTDGPLTVGYTDKVDLKWTSSNIAINGCTFSSSPVSGSGSWNDTNEAASGTNPNVGPLVASQYVYTVTCNAIAGAANATASDSVTVDVGLPSVSCSANPPTTVFTDENVTWTATPVPASGLPTGTFYSYAWTSAGATLVSQANNTYQVKYAATGSKTASVVMTAPGGRTLASQACTNLVTVNPTIPTVVLKVRTAGSSDAFVPDALTIQDKTRIDLKWETTNGPTSCTGTATKLPGTTNAQVAKWNSDSKTAGGGTDNDIGTLASTDSPITFKIVCSKAGVADISSTVVVTVVSPISVYMEAVPNPVLYNTAPVLKWSTRGSPTTCTASGGWTGDKSTSSATTTETLSAITVPTTYTITCSKVKAVNAVSSVPVGVYLAQPGLTTTTRTCASPSDNGKINLTLTQVVGATGYKLHRSDNGGATYNQLPIGAPVTYTAANFPTTDSSLTPNTVYYYQVEAVGAGGVSPGFSTIKSAPASECKLPTCTLTATPASITRDVGDSSTLAWTSSADTVTVTSAGSSGATAIPNFPISGSTNLNGSTSVTPNNSTTYGITVTNLSGSNSCTALVTVSRRPLAVTCYASAASQDDLTPPAQNDPNQTVQIDLKTNQNVTWRAVGTYAGGRMGGVPPYTYTWAGDAPLAGQTGIAPAVSYSSSGVKSGQVTVTDSQSSSITADCTNRASVIDSRCNFGMVPNPSTIKMTFVGDSAVSRKSWITVFPPDCSQTITLSPTSMNIVDSTGVIVPVTLNFFTHGLNPPTPDTVIEPNTYAVGLDMSVTARQFIKPGRYPLLLQGTGNAVDPLDRNKPTTIRPLTITLDVATATPKFQEF